LWKRASRKNISAAPEVALAKVNARPLLIELRDAIARLFSPFL